MTFDKYGKLGAYHWKAYHAEPVYRRHVDRVVNWIAERGNILDVGAGDGLITAKLGCCGIDNEPTAVRLAETYGVPVTLGEVYALAGKWDAIYLGDVLEHLEHPDKAIRRIGECTSKLYVCTPPRRRTLRPYHVREWTASELIAWFRLQGWKCVGTVEEANDRLYGVFVRECGVIYTAMFGKLDVLLDPRQSAGVDAICYTDLDSLESNVYEIRKIETDETDSRLRQRQAKLYSNDIMDSYDWSVYVDTNAQLLAHPLDLLSDMGDGDSDIAMVRHPHRRCAYAEADECRIRKLADERLLQRQVRGYRRAGLPVKFGLWCGTMIVRRHTPEIKALSRAWLTEVETHTVRDQISLPFVLWVTKTKIHTINANLHDNEIVYWGLHQWQAS